MTEPMHIQWYPGHMAKTRRQIEADLKQVDAVCEIVDARIPSASRNPDIDAICGGKPRMAALSRIDLADGGETRRWLDYFRRRGFAAIGVDLKRRKGIGDFQPALRELLAEKIARDAAKGMRRPLRVMVLGIPNVGKSTFINQISGRKGAKTENRPGVTRGKQWVTVDPQLLLLDTPGILWPKFEDPVAGLLLAATGAVKETVVDTEELAARVMELLYSRYPGALEERYRLDPMEAPTGFALLEAAGRKRGMLLPGGQIDTGRMARAFLDEYRSGKLGRFTLEAPPEDQQ